jgi:glycosyltransferase involved in cell wall biosynthesis
LRERTRFEPWTAEAEKNLLSQMDVGLMPLDDNDWCRGKGGYKLIQYMTAAVAALASAVGANLEIVLEGRTGMFVRELKDWRRCLEIFFSNPELCTSMGNAGRQRAQEIYDYARTKPVFYNVLKEATKK